MRSFLVAVGCLVLVLTGAACTDDAGIPVPDDHDRVAVVRQLREVVGEPALRLGQGAGEVEASIQALRIEPPDDPDRRLTTVSATRSGPVRRLSDALDALRAVSLPEGPDTPAVRSALETLAGAGEQLRHAAERELDLVAEVAAADAELAELVATWQAPGSRSQQLERLATTAEQATSLAGSLRSLEPVVPCLEDVQRRVEAAEFVAAATRELRQTVAAGRGGAFDARREELAQDPYGSGEPLTVSPEPGCWAAGSPTAQAAGSLRTALESLETALNPGDLASPRSG